MKKADSWNPQQYDRFKSERSQPFYDLMNLLESIPHATVVDLGCGTGELTAELHRHTNAALTMGIDSSVQMLSETKKFESQQLHFAKSDISFWQEPAKYDIVFSNAALQWRQNHESIFKNIKSSLRPNGQIAIQMPMNHDYPTHVTAFNLSLEQPWAQLLNDENRSQSNMLKAEEYALLLFKLGFKKQKVMTQVYSHILDSREDVIEWVKGTLLTYYKSRLTEENYQEFLAEFRTRLFKELPDEKPFFYPFKRILIWGKL